MTNDKRAQRLLVRRKGASTPGAVVGAKLRGAEPWGAQCGESGSRGNVSIFRSPGNPAAEAHVIQLVGRGPQTGFNVS